MVYLSCSMGPKGQIYSLNPAGVQIFRPSRVLFTGGSGTEPDSSTKSSVASPTVTVFIDLAVDFCLTISNEGWWG